MDTYIPWWWSLTSEGLPEPGQVESAPGPKTVYYIYIYIYNIRTWTMIEIEIKYHKKLQTTSSSWLTFIYSNILAMKTNKQVTIIMIIEEKNDQGSLLREGEKIDIVYLMMSCETVSSSEVERRKSSQARAMRLVQGIYIHPGGWYIHSQRHNKWHRNTLSRSMLLRWMKIIKHGDGPR